MSGPALEPPRTSPLLFWAVVLSTVGLFAVSSLAALVAGETVGSSLSTNQLWGLVIEELVLGAVWFPVLRSRGWSFNCTTIAPTTWDIPRAVGLTGICLVVAWVASSTVDRLVPGSPDALGRTVLDSPLSLPSILVVSLVNPIAEEFLYLGFIANVLRRRSENLAVAASLIARAVVHTYQGPERVAGIVAIGLVMALYYCRTRRLWVVAFAHGFVDALGLASAGLTLH